MPANQLPSQHYFSAIVIASLIASVAFFDFAIFLYLSDLLQHILFWWYGVYLAFSPAVVWTIFSRLYCQTLGRLDDWLLW
ncbi:hypothetical protein AO377_1317 [Moraxella catarrhalis]|nr:hypothetical protein AO377_1317 [Moraxella catarrhalis]